jgi:hypothetical protein
MKYARNDLSVKTHFAQQSDVGTKTKFHVFDRV